MALVRWRVAAGLVSAIVVLGIAELVAAVVRPGSSPPYVLGAAVVDHTPEGLREWAIQTFGTADKAVLFVCMALVALAVAGLAGALERTHRAIGTALFAVFAVAATLLAVGRHGAPGAFATLLGTAAGIWALRSLTRRIDDATRVNSPAPEVGSAAVGGTAVGGTVIGADPSDSVLRGGPRTAGNGPAPGTGSGLGTSTSSSAGADRGTGTAGGSGAEEDGVLAPGGSIRRELLRGMAIAGGAAVAAGLAGHRLGGWRAGVGPERAAIRLPETSGPPISLAPGADLEVPGLSPFVTSNADFYRIDTALIVPQVSVEDWSLRIHGMVEREIRIGWEELAERTAIERLITLACVSNPVGGDLIGNALWRGYRLDELLAEAGPLPEADMVLSRSKDGWTAGSPLAVLTDGRDAMLAVGMNGEPLPIDHGYPARLVVPGLYGYVSATKWVTDLEITRFDRATAYWTRRGWSERGPIKTGTRIDTPGWKAKLSAGRIPVAGVAWAQHRGISAVEVQVDDGPWEQARLSTEQSIDTWRQWVFDWEATPGPHTLRARATDGTGETQTSEFAGSVPDGATGYPSVSLRVE
ncbi:molybdopterin-dependent oxidoreductase [Nocardia shimofusensis]|uniref:molybdopterin-dependent oxidoreductase n=1 Tax=Nocardia shimofusensis TaxID=228596 RepID=UPI00082F9F14|nr:molybdopterin-dependent oxidoreductase [Nocardia shimofusensis]